MPTLAENLKIFGETYQWLHAGEEWSRRWGTAHMQWFGSILPRISSFVPAGTILEIAPGYGRWTAFLKSLCQHLIVVDLTPRCIEECQKRFAEDKNISFYVNDGSSLEMIEDRSVDFIFTFDSLVHAEDTVLRAYTREFAKKLKPDGVSFIHHSNLGEYGRLSTLQTAFSRIPRMVGWMSGLHIWDNVMYQTRARSMTAAKMALFAEEYGLQCISQELITWETRSTLIDSFSTIVRQGSRWSRSNRVVRNPGFMREADGIRKMATLYDCTHAAAS